MSFLIVLGSRPLCTLHCGAVLSAEGSPKETHSMIKFPDGQMVHDPDCQQGVCGKRKVRR